jgi:hypothetical protein
MNVAGNPSWKASYIKIGIYASIQSPRTGKRWATELIKKVWTVAWDQWEHRNAKLNDQDNLVHQEVLRKLGNITTQAYQKYQPLLPSMDQHVLHSP